MLSLNKKTVTGGCFFMVLWEGLEPSSLTRYASETYAYTNSATTAYLMIKKGIESKVFFC